MCFKFIYQRNFDIFCLDIYQNLIVYVTAINTVQNKSSFQKSQYLYSAHCFQIGKNRRTYHKQNQNNYQVRWTFSQINLSLTRGKSHFSVRIYSYFYLKITKKWPKTISIENVIHIDVKEQNILKKITEDMTSMIKRPLNTRESSDFINNVIGNNNKYGHSKYAI